MAQAKKFGTFGGVFTPSILTILGVIMYLRLGYVVGEAGLYAVLALILVAHIISISTGLSLSSIATDKKIKTGGIYYMLSRSLGLPMGGSIGITLFLGTALSISLYIVGFVENFLSIDAVSQFLGMQGSVNDVRIIGTTVIIILVIIAYISTSIAIKTQFFILGAIALSIVSIIIGITTNSDFSATEVALTTAPNAPDLIVLFAIFFPAVTGFTAGVAMSGDLKSPKDSIPKGTLLAIGVGFLVYVSLAIMFAVFVDRAVLISDTNFLLKVAWFSPLVIAGIWGATLSSALGGILGAPRIFQAMSFDKVTPSFFAKGVGDSNEPRRALILTFILAELGILIGELDVIAGLVSMFYIAAYGFINLAYVLERWSNSDFRPSMRVSIWVGIIGFVASIFVMMNLDAFGMLLAFVIMFGIYAFLKRREVQGNMTDVWQSVWTSIIRSSLNRINKKPLTETNWQPNIILFSGGGNSRSHLMEFGLNIAGKQGFLSNFDLHVNKDSELLFSKAHQKIASDVEDRYVGVFTRRQTVNDIYEGIEMISQTYGFSGVEPNTVMMGWARQTNDPKRFSQLVSRLSKLDMNVVLLDYDKRVGWGKRQSIDIWWRGGGHNGNLALSLTKFITSSEEWLQATVRLIIVNPYNDLSASIHDDAQTVLDNLRIDADIMIINNEIEKRSFYDIIQVESINTDLIFLGFSPIKEGKEEIFVEKTSRLCQNIGTVAIIHASSEFKRLSLGGLKKSEQNEISIESQEQKPIIESLARIKKAEIKPYFDDFNQNTDHILQVIRHQLVEPIFEVYLKWLENLMVSSEKSFDNLIQRAPNNQIVTFQKTIEVQHGIFMRGQIQYAENHLTGIVERILEENLEKISQELLDYKKTIKSYPYRIKETISKDDFRSMSLINNRLKRKSFVLKPLFLFQNKIPYYVHFRELLQMHYPHQMYVRLSELVGHFGFQNYKFENDMFKAIQKISDVFNNTYELAEKGIPTTDELNIQKDQIIKIIEQIKENREMNLEEINHYFRSIVVEDMSNLTEAINHPLTNSFINRNLDYIDLLRKEKKRFKHALNIWSKNDSLVNNLNILNSQLLSFRFKTVSFLNDLETKLNGLISSNLMKPLQQFIEILELTKEKEGNSQLEFITQRLKNITYQVDYRVQQSFIDQQKYSHKKVKAAIDDFPDVLNVFMDTHSSTQSKKEIQSYFEMEVAVKRTLDYMVEKEFVEINELLIVIGQEFNTINNKYAELNQMILLPSSESDTANDELRKVIDNRLDYNERLGLVADQASGLLIDVQEKQQYLSGVIQKKVVGLKANLDLYPFIRNIQELKNFIKTENTKKWFSKILLFNQEYRVFFTNQLNKIWYNQSSGMLLAQKLSKSIIDQETRVETLLKFKDEVSPLSKVTKKLPDYYKQLFLRKQFYLNEFWVGREEEISSFRNAYRQWNDGYSGGILVLGERNSGKSFFSNYIHQQIEIKGDVFHVNPPYTGSVEVADLLNSFQSVTEINASFAKIFNEVPKGSVFFIDDLELWWEKSAQGMKVVDRLISIINRFGDQHLFVVLCNIHSFRLINKYKKIESAFLSLIELSPFNAKQLKDIVLKRHQSSSLKFVINNISESNYRSWNYARLFSRIFNYSEGNPGVALQSWIKSISESSNKEVILERPKIPDSAPLRYLETEWMIFILQFILHKRMNLAKLIRVTQESRADVIRKVRILKRTGLIIEIGHDILDINPFVLPFLRKALVKRELL